MSTELTTTNGNGAAMVAPSGGFDREQIDLIKNTVAQGTSDLELKLFLEVCKTTGLNPFQRQLYAIMRNQYNPRTRENESRMTIQTGIDGYRLIASRTGKHAGTSDAEYGPDNADGYPTWARVTVHRLLPNGTIADFTATARWKEYAQTTREGKPSGQWPKMPYLMLGKCAEALALRKAFPAELSGVYTAEEMSQADSYQVDRSTGEVANHPAVQPTPQPPPSLNREQIKRLFAIATEHKVSNEEVKALMIENFQIDSTKLLTKGQYERLCDVLIPEAHILGEEAITEAELIESIDHELGAECSA